MLTMHLQIAMKDMHILWLCDPLEIKNVKLLNISFIVCWLICIHFLFPAVYKIFPTVWPEHT